MCEIIELLLLPSIWCPLPKSNDFLSSALNAKLLPKDTIELMVLLLKLLLF